MPDLSLSPLTAKFLEVSDSPYVSNRVDFVLAIDPPPPGGSFLHYIVPKQPHIRNKMTHISPLYVGALTCNVNVNYTTKNYVFRLR